MINTDKTLLDVFLKRCPGFTTRIKCEAGHWGGSGQMQKKHKDPTFPKHSEMKLVTSSRQHLAECRRLVMVSVIVQVWSSLFKAPSGALRSLSLFVHSPSSEQGQVDKRNPAPTTGLSRLGCSASSSSSHPHPLTLYPSFDLAVVLQIPREGMDHWRAKTCGIVKRNSWLDTETHTPWHWYHTHTHWLPFLMLPLNSLT